MIGLCLTSGIAEKKKNTKTNDLRATNNQKKMEAFEYVERSKSKALLSMLSSTEINPSHILKKQYPILLEREKILRLRLKEIETRHLRNNDMVNIGMYQRTNTKLIDTNIISNPSSKFDPEELEETQKELDQIYDIFKEIDEEYVDLRRGRPLSFEEIQRKLQLK